MIIKRDIWRTADGAWIWEPSEGSGILVFAAGSDVSDELLVQHGLAAEKKQGPPPQDKEVAKPNDKGRPGPTARRGG